jgi:hypothetical protein
MIPGGDGFFYGYTITYPHFWDEGYVQSSRPSDQRLERFWWHYPGTVFIPGGGFQPEFAKGGEPERAQRADILNRPLAAGLESLRGLDFDVLSMLTFDQRVTVLGLAAGTGKAADASLVARVLHSTPAAEFPLLEHRLSANGTMSRLIGRPGPEGSLAMIGRVFTVKSLEAGLLPSHDLDADPGRSVDHGGHEPGARVRPGVGGGADQRRGRPWDRGRAGGGGGDASRARRPCQHRARRRHGARGPQPRRASAHPRGASVPRAL